MIELRQLRSCYTELLKLASGIPDAGTRELLEYGQNNINKKEQRYQKARDYTVSGIKGGLTGLGVLGGTSALLRKKKMPTISHTRRAVAGGAGLSVLDQAYRSKKTPEAEKLADIGALAVTDSHSGLRSPGAQLAPAKAVGSFRQVNHNEGRKPKSLQIGQKFRVA